MKKDKQKVLDRIRARTKPEEKEFIKMNLSISRQIVAILKEKGWTQKELANKLDKKESEVSRLLSGFHNFSLKSISKLQVVLGKEIIVTPIEACNRYKTIEYVTLRVHAKTNSPTKESVYNTTEADVTYKINSIKKAS
jgi:transcriptional regulator with XRE-family HTH domain